MPNLIYKISKQVEVGNKSTPFEQESHSRNIRILKPIEADCNQLKTEYVEKKEIPSEVKTRYTKL